VNPFIKCGKIERKKSNSEDAFKENSKSAILNLLILIA
jgi:hypothetical protein